MRVQLLAGAAVIVFAISLAALFSSGLPGSMAPKLGGVSDVRGVQNDAELEALGRFAVENENKEKNANLEFSKVVAVKQQVVAGIMYYLTIEASQGGQRGHYEAKVWVKQWENFKQVEGFKHLGPMVSSTEAGTHTGGQ